MEGTPMYQVAKEYYKKRPREICLAMERESKRQKIFIFDRLPAELVCMIDEFRYRQEHIDNMRATLAYIKTNADYPYMFKNWNHKRRNSCHHCGRTRISLLRRFPKSEWLRTTDNTPVYHGPLCDWCWTDLIQTVLKLGGKAIQEMPMVDLAEMINGVLARSRKYE
jgi:hypothetical protein